MGPASHGTNGTLKDARPALPERIHVPLGQHRQHAVAVCTHGDVHVACNDRLPMGRRDTLRGKGG
eukprot:15453501-Alexandrium_andersonii.AAC.1